MVFDVISRYLRHRGYQLTYVRNITDIDDKIIRARGREQRADRRAHRSASSRRCTRTARAWRSCRPMHEPRATQFVPQIIAMVSELIARDYAYVAANGDVMYAVARFAGYGRLSGKRLADLRSRRARRGGRGQARSAGLRAVEARQARRAGLGVALGCRGGPAGTSSARPCRPRCWAPTSTCTAAGMDLKFPHHENEIAQSCAATRRSVREPVDAQRLRQRRRGEDVQVARQLLHGARGAAGAAAPGGAALSSCSPATTAGRSTIRSSSSSRRTRRSAASIPRCAACREVAGRAGRVQRALPGEHGR